MLLCAPHVQKSLFAKLQRKWKGPYCIVECCQNHTYSLRHTDTHVLQNTFVHANRLKPFSEGNIPQGGGTQEQGGNAEQEDSPADEAERPNSQSDLTVNEDTISRRPDHSIDTNMQPDLSQTEDTQKQSRGYCVLNATEEKYSNN